MDARKCKGCNAKEGRLCWSAYLQQPANISELEQCPDPMINTLDSIDDCLCKLQQAFMDIGNNDNTII